MNIKFNLSKFSGVFSPGYAMYWAMLFAFAIMFLNLGTEGIFAAQEGRTAIITRNMLLSGNYVDMTVEHGIPYEKPAGHYWLCLLPAKLCGIEGDPLYSRAEWGVRLPSALGALLCCWLCGRLAGRIYGEREGAVSIVILSSMATFATLGRLARIDMLLTASIMGANYFLFTGYLEEKIRNPEQKITANFQIYGFYLMLAAGMLLKGTLPVLLAGITILLCMIFFHDWKMIRQIRPFSGGLLFMLVAMPWYVLANIRSEGAFFDEFIINQNLRRFTGIGSTYRGGERMSYFYYFPKMFAGMLPWSLAGAAALAVFAKKIFHRTLKLRKETIFLLLWFAGGFIFFSLSALKRGDYVLGLYPPAAILIARSTVMFFDRAPELWNRWRIILWSIGGVLAAALLINLSGIFIAIGEKNAAREWSFMSRRDGMSMAMISSFINEHLLLTIAAAAVFLLLIYGFFRCLEKRQMGKSFIFLAFLVLILFSSYHGIIQPGIDKNKTVKPFVREARRYLGENEKVLYIGDFNTEMIFFLNRPYDVKMDDTTRFLISGEATFQPLADSGDWEILLRTGKDHQYPAALMKRRQAEPPPEYSASAQQK